MEGVEAPLCVDWWVSGLRFAFELNYISAAHSHTHTHSSSTVSRLAVCNFQQMASHIARGARPAKATQHLEVEDAESGY